MVPLAQAVAEGGSYVVSPNVGLLLWTLLAFSVMPAAAFVTAAKGRWGWLAVGLLTGGFICVPVAIFIDFVPGSFWSRRVARRSR